MSLNLPYIKGTSEKLRSILRSYKIRYTFLIESTFSKLLCKLIYRVAAEEKSSIIYDCSNCEAAYIGESKRPLKLCSDKHKRSAGMFNCEKNEIAKHCWKANHNFSWYQKKGLERESRLIPRKIKKTIHSLKYPNHINEISYMLPEIWLSHLL